MEIIIDDDLARDVEDYCRNVGREPEEFVCDSLRQYLAIHQFQQIHAEMVSDAETEGYVTDEDVFRDVS